LPSRQAGALFPLPGHLQEAGQQSTLHDVNLQGEQRCFYKMERINEFSRMKELSRIKEPR
jgi:hypothetical protein